MQTTDSTMGKDGRRREKVRERERPKRERDSKQRGKIEERERVCEMTGKGSVYGK